MRKEILLSIFVGVILVSFYFGITFIRADQKTDLGQLITEKTIDLGMSEVYKIGQYQKNGQDSWVISRENNKAKKTLSLSGFEDEVNQCKKPLFTIGATKIICLKGNVGVHSQNLELVNLETLEPIKFQDGEESYSGVISDVPNFQLEKTTFFVDMRNYDNDPLMTAIRLSFNFSEGRFTFDKKGNITYDGNNNSLLGDI